MHVLIRRGIFVVTCFLFCAAPGCSYYAKWFGPSPTFQGLDRDKNSVISPAEWGEPSCSLRREATSENCAEDRRARLQKFACMDVNRDGVVTWSEYYDLQFANKTRCSFAPVQVPPTESLEPVPPSISGPEDAIATHDR